MPVQWVNRPDLDFRGFSGTISGGMVKPGDAIRAQPSGRESRVTRIVTASGDLPLAVAGQSITLTLADEIDISRGDVISPPRAGRGRRQFECTVVWMAEEADAPGPGLTAEDRRLTMSATLAEPKYRINVNTLEHLAAKRLDLNEIGVCNVTMDRAVPFDPYASNRDTGGFILIDRMSNHTVGAGMLHFALRRSHNIHVQPVDVNKAARAAQKRSGLHCCGSPASRAPASRRSPTGRQEAACPRPHCLSPRRRQRRPALPGSRLHRKADRGRTSGALRDRQADGRRRLVVRRRSSRRPGRAGDGARAVRRGRVHRDPRRHALEVARAAMSRACTEGATRRACQLTGTIALRSTGTARDPIDTVAASSEASATGDRPPARPG